MPIFSSEQDKQPLMGLVPRVFWVSIKYLLTNCIEYVYYIIRCVYCKDILKVE